MTTITKTITGVGTLTSKNIKTLASYELSYPVPEPANDSIQQALVDSITGHLKTKDAVPESIFAEKSLLFEMQHLNLTFRFSFINKSGEIRVEKWVEPDALTAKQATC